MDIDKLIYTLLSPLGIVKPNASASSADNLPLILYAATSGGRVANGARGLGETWTVALSVIADDFSSARSLGVTVSDRLYEAWESAQAVPGAGVIAYLDETTMFAQSPPTALVAQDVHQRNAVFTVTIRPA